MHLPIYIFKGKRERYWVVGFRDFNDVIHGVLRVFPILPASSPWPPSVTTMPSGFLKEDKANKEIIKDFLFS